MVSTLLLSDFPIESYIISTDTDNAREKTHTEETKLGHRAVTTPKGIHALL